MYAKEMLQGHGQYQTARQFQGTCKRSRVWGFGSPHSRWNSSCHFILTFMPFAFSLFSDLLSSHFSQPAWHRSSSTTRSLTLKRRAIGVSKLHSSSFILLKIVVAQNH